MLPALKKKIGRGFWVAIDAAGVVLSLAGASVVALFGKLMFAVVLGAVALGFFLRLAGRRAQPAVLPMPTPRWCYVIAGLLSIFEVALLIEATDLPVRFHQPGFELHHWVLVLVALVVAFTVQLQLFRSFLRIRKQRVLS